MQELLYFTSIIKVEIVSLHKMNRIFMRTSQSIKIQDRQNVLKVRMQPRHKKYDNVFQIDMI